MESLKLLSNEDYTKFVKNFAVWKSLKQQKEEINNCSKIIEENINCLKSLLTSIIEGTILF